MKSGPVVACLEYLEGGSFCCKMTSTRPIMIGKEDFKDFLIPDTSSQDLIWAKFEQVAPNPSEWGAFLHDLALLF